MVRFIGFFFTKTDSFLSAISAAYSLYGEDRRFKTDLTVRREL